MASIKQIWNSQHLTFHIGFEFREFVKLTNNVHDLMSSLFRLVTPSKLISVSKSNFPDLNSFFENFILSYVHKFCYNIYKTQVNLVSRSLQATSGKISHIFANFQRVSTKPMNNIQIRSRLFRLFNFSCIPYSKYSQTTKTIFRSFSTFSFHISSPIHTDMQTDKITEKVFYVKITSSHQYCD